MCHRVLSLCLLLRCHKVKLMYVCRWNGFFELLFQLYSPLASVASSSHLCKLWVRVQLAVVVDNKQKLKIRDWCTGVDPHSSGLVHCGQSTFQWIGALGLICTLSIAFWHLPLRGKYVVNQCLEFGDDLVNFIWQASKHLTRNLDRLICSSVLTASIQLLPPVYPPLSPHFLWWVGQEEWKWNRKLCPGL